jgi:tetratricopeptide (TPR) repeat protein/tRNA A-37 threonylcarbamoyl transferase component Bud32
VNHPTQAAGCREVILTSQQIAHYRIIQKLGAGGMGEVFLAQDTKLERKVAIKMLPAKSIDDAQARRRLVREARAAATLDHPNICAVHEVNEDAGCVFIVMQYVEGETLAEKLLGRQLSTDEVLDIGVQVGEALSEAHSGGVIHRDIKPSNVIVTPRGQVKVLDFGLARVTQIEKRSDPDAQTETQLTQEGYIVGTVAYMSPEQLKGLPVDSRSDIFSLGVLLYECAAGAPPFAGNSKIEISSKVLQVDPRKPSELNPRIPPLLEIVILKAMAKDADDRYQSVDEIIHDLKGVRSSLSGATELLPSATRRTTASELAGSPLTVLRSRKVQVGLAIAAVAIIGTLIAVRFWRSPYQPVAAAKPYYEKGVDAIHAGTYFQASKLLKQSVDLDSQYAPAHARLGEAYLEIGNTEQAKDELLAANALAGRRNLAKNDKLQLDAIDATVRHDFAAAIAGYQTISDQSTTPEKAEAHVDLGRAYERNEQLDKAIENYLKATNEDPQSAGAFLHLGIASGRKHDADNAERAFKKAEQIYRVLTNNEGQVEVEFQRGMLFYGSGKLAEAKAEFEKVLDALKSLTNPYQLTRTELALSLVYRDEGNLERAKQMAIDAIRVAQMSDIKNVATNGLIDLGLAFMSNGAFDEAGNYFQQALDLARRDKSTATEMRAHLSLGRLAFQKNDNDTAISELQTALNFYQAAKYLRETSIALTVLGRAYQDKGDNQTALKLFEEQAALAKQADDASGVSDSHMSLAMLLGSNEEKYTEALAHLDEKLSNDDARHSKRGMASDQMNRGRFLWQLGRYDDARAALDAAYDLANDKEAQLKTVLAWVHLIRAQVALSQAQYSEAKKEAQLASDFKFPDVTLQAHYTSGLAQALSGSLPEGRKLCEEALEAAENVKSSPLATSARLALAEVMLLQKDSAAALDNALQLEKVFAQSGQQDSEWRALLIAARASDLTGNKTAAREYAARAAQTCNALQPRWGAEAYQSYLKRPDIQTYQKQLADLLKT